MYGQWTIDREQTFKEYGYYPEELSFGSKKPIVVVCEHCKKIWWKRKREAKGSHRCPTILNGKKYCFKCSSEKDVSEFSKNRHRADGYQKVCKQCFSEYECVKKGYKKSSNSKKYDFNTRLKYKVNSLRQSAKKKKLPFNLSSTSIIELFDKQNGKCYYTGVDLIVANGVFDINSLSVDRLDPMLGYVEENIVLCTVAINSFKNYMSEQEFIQYLKKILPNLTKFINK